MPSKKKPPYRPEGFQGWVSPKGSDVIVTEESDPQTIAWITDHRNRKMRTPDETRMVANLVAAAPALLYACLNPTKRNIKFALMQVALK